MPKVQNSYHKIPPLDYILKNFTVCSVKGKVKVKISLLQAMEDHRVPRG
jgi:hypothetical protein